MINNNADIEHNNNIIVSKDTEGMEKLLKKLNNELELKKNNFVLPESNLDLDFGEDFDFIIPSNPKIEKSNNNTNNLNININNFKNNITNNDFENKQNNNEKLDNSDKSDDIIVSQINLNENSTEIKNNSIKNEERNPINIQFNENENNNNNQSSNNIILNINNKKGNNLLISSLNINNNDNFEENEEIEFDVNEIVDIQKQEINKIGIKKEEEERIKKEEEERIKKEEEERIKKEEEERIKKEEEERIRKEEEERIRKEEEERIKKEEEEERIRKEEEERIKKEEEERNNFIDINKEIIEKEKEKDITKLEAVDLEIENQLTQNEKKSNKSNIIKKEESENEDKKEKKSINQDSINNTPLIPEKFKNSKLFNSLSEELKTNSISTLKDIQKLRANKKQIKDIDIYPTILIDFNKQEESLDNLITNFSDKIKNEDKEETEKRKHSFINHIYFEGKIGTDPLLQLMPECQISHIDLLIKINNEEHLKNIPIINDDYEKIIFSDENSLISEYYSPIGQLEDIKGFIFKYNLEENTKLYINCFKSFSYWRNIEGDGNSFYRTFMFGLIEYYILNRSEEELNQIISEISSDKLINVYKEYNINYNKCFIILGAIIHLLCKNNIEKAYDLFIKSYLLEDGSFDQMLIIYLRYISYIYVDEVIKLSEDEKIKEEMEEEITSKGINKELIKTMNVEPNFFIICLMPYLFDVNINIFWIDRVFTQSKDGIINFIDEENTENIPLISFGYFYSSYFRIYSNNYIQENEEINEIFKSKTNTISKLTLEVKNPKLCEICKNDKFIVFLEQKFKICKKCLEKYINQICSFRTKSLNNDNYIGLEYYSRAFNLQDNYILNDYEFIEIKEETNIINYLQYIASIICSKCKQHFDKKNLNNLKCKCLLCDKCLENMILELTNGLKILNSYEKKNLGEKNCSSCGGHFIYEDSIEHLKDIKEKDKENAIKRMCDYVNTICLVCGDKVRKKQEINDSNSKNNNKEQIEDDNNKEKNNEIYRDIKNYKKIKIRRENERRKGIDYLDIDHVICINCYEKMKSNYFDDENIIETENDSPKKKRKKTNHNNSISSNNEDKSKKNKYYINFDEGECFCFICNKRHYLIDKNIKSGGCCTSGCNIF